MLTWCVADLALVQVNPNGQPGWDMCAVASFEQPKPGTEAWGWSDTSCSDKHIAICKIRRTRP